VLRTLLQDQAHSCWHSGAISRECNAVVVQSTCTRRACHWRPICYVTFAWSNTATTAWNCLASEPSMKSSITQIMCNGPQMKDKQKKMYVQNW